MPAAKKTAVPKRDDNLHRTLILFEAALSIIFLSIGYYTNSMYFRGVGIGLVIAWVTSALAHYIGRKR